jgi:hypothetical protein
MNKTEREQIRRLVADFKQWSQRAEEVRAWHRAVQEAAKSGERDLGARSAKITRAGEVAWRVVPLETSDTGVVRRLWERANLPATTADDRALLRLLTENVARAIADVRPALDVRRFFTGSARKQAADTAAEFLRGQHPTIIGADGPGRLEQLGVFTAPVDPARLTFDALLDPVLRFDLVHNRTGPAPGTFDRSVVDGLPEALNAIAKVVASEASYRGAARDAGDEVRRAEVQRMLQEMPVDALKKATGDRLRVSALSQAGIRTVQEVLNRGRSLQTLFRASGMCQRGACSRQPRQSGRRRTTRCPCGSTSTAGIRKRLACSVASPNGTRAVRPGARQPTSSVRPSSNHC